jgi:carbon starvation protein
LRDASGQVVPAWKIFWTIFGTSNQLLAGLTLLGLTMWLKSEGKAWQLTAVPMFFMLGMTLWALARTVAPWALPLLHGQWRWDLIGVIAAVLLGLAALMVWESARLLRAKPLAVPLPGTGEPS